MQETLPRLSRGAEAFYDPDSGELDLGFEVHVDQLRTLRYEGAQVFDPADSLMDGVRADGERLR